MWISPVSPLERGEGSQPRAGLLAPMTSWGLSTAAGGWSDTPPLAYELGGAVLGLAVRVDGRRPIGARACRISEPELWLAAGPRQGEMAMKIVCRSLEDLQDYCQPHAPGQGTQDICQ